LAKVLIKEAQGKVDEESSCPENVILGCVFAFNEKEYLGL
jgi:hypothetical protein